jgi:hypothetical protein
MGVRGNVRLLDVVTGADAREGDHELDHSPSRWPFDVMSGAASVILAQALG